jgi:hypothetical protein
VIVGTVRTRIAGLPAPTRRRIRLSRTILFAALLVGAGTWYASSGLDAGRRPEPPLAVAAPTPPPAPAPSTSGPAPASVRAAPIHVRVPAIDVDAELVQVGILDDDVMEVPDDVATIGWYDPDPDPVSGAGLGVIPGVQGTAVLAGHVDSRTQGRGALYDLRELTVGATIEVDHADGTSSTWQVTEVIRYPKATLPYHEVFTWSGPPRLALITCGGEFDRTARSYTDNIVVYAVPLDGSSGSAAPAA